VPTERRYVLTLSCPDTTGIVARIAGFLAAAGGWIVEAGYHSDADSGWFFTRQVVRADSLPFEVDELRLRFADVAAELGACDRSGHDASTPHSVRGGRPAPGSDRSGHDASTPHSVRGGRPAPDQASWTVTDTGLPKRAVLLVSKEMHCLHDLLGRLAAGELPARLEAVIGNHDTLEDVVQAHGVPFHHVPFPTDPDGKAAAFAEIARLVDKHEPEAVVLARFMQILPPWLCERWAGRALNIHHSFLPSFVGARPYHQAHARGVKLIGATCHYVTADLDAGPIVEQDVIRVDHGDTVADMVRRGRDIERLVLARGLRWHLEDRVLVHGNKTVVFR
jgi:formyltetrahydrofolate deformylase